MFAITRGKGFHIKFENGYTLSCQIGRGNYCQNYDEKITSDNRNIKPSLTAELAIICPNGDLFSFEDGDTVKGYQTTEEFLKLSNFTAEL